jgi:hypothetical protein
LAIKAILTALFEKAKRLVYLSSGVRRGVDVSLQDITARPQSPRNAVARVEAALLARTGVGGAKAPLPPDKHDHTAVGRRDYCMVAIP